MTESLHHLPPTSQRLLKLCQLLTLAGIALFLGSLTHMVISSFGSGEGIDADLKEELLDEPYEGAFPAWLRLLALFLMLMSTVPGLIALWQSFRLFSAYRRGEVFTLLAARRLRLIGWMIVLLCPSSMAMQALGCAIFAWWTRPGHTRVSLSFDDGDLYALVFGLLIVVVAQVMAQAIDISDENQAII